MKPPGAKSLRWLPSALDDLFQIAEYISANAPQAADQFIQAVFAKTKQLRDFPYLGSICPYYPKARQLIHGNYVIYYTVHRNEVTVRAVVHGARLFRARW